MRSAIGPAPDAPATRSPSSPVVLCFLLRHVFFVAAWTCLNLGFVPGLRPFDPFPFGVLSVVVSSEALFLTIFVLISQHRMVRQAEKRAHFDLKLGMLAEQELTALLQMQRKICQ